MADVSLTDPSTRPAQGAGVNPGDNGSRGMNDQPTAPGDRIPGGGQPPNPLVPTADNWVERDLPPASPGLPGLLGASGGHVAGTPQSVSRAVIHVEANVPDDSNAPGR